MTLILVDVIEDVQYSSIFSIIEIRFFFFMDKDIYLICDLWNIHLTIKIDNNNKNNKQKVRLTKQFSREKRKTQQESMKRKCINIINTVCLAQSSNKLAKKQTNNNTQIKST
ncbi:unnamed protein product [Schistosoma margrebowiei]|uniref:Uncharacterized protein n=1 Tax=Schistosoma margrebowiei TaxID=48269 RepID=A0A183MYU5_9TREM|nr:unnamed protein product [Schistosoma margrebowiei]